MSDKAAARYPTTPDGRYFVVRGRLWRCSNPALPEKERQQLVNELMSARSAVGRALRHADKAAEVTARQRVHAAKVALGERGPVWWADGAPDYNRHMAVNSPYKAWFEALEPHE
ncbi:MAG: hypothetical protein KDD73_02325 [Anaerolineales bacterium]|nr:hypothetical protein [Anaerolineales bacterium]MCB9127287.1 hypothetical protein [Ardenticatenales bacterium]MCB9172576.1 hypothetical protein [Ardenticatenales bacterium]